MIKYPSTEQLRHIVREVKSKHDFAGKTDDGQAFYCNKTPYPVLKFIGTVKVHGTNAGIIKHKDGSLSYQSRSRELSLEEDNAGFMESMIRKNLDFLFDRFNFNEHIAIYGEWCGGNIQKGVAISGMQKMFIIFAIKIDEEWVELPSDLQANEGGIFNILQFGTYEIDIDFNNPELSQNKIIEMTIDVENECPVGKFFGKSGVGEGIVFTCATDRPLRFKSKGEKHSVSKVIALNVIDEASIIKLDNFVSSTLTENRLLQGIQYLQEMQLDIDIKNIGQFIRWCVNDVNKEEGDIRIELGLDEKKVNQKLSQVSKNWFLNYLNTL